VVKAANTWDELAAKIGVPPAQLHSTATRFNELAHNGHDDDFNRGDSVYDNYYGDPTLPNPNLHPLGKPPYYAFRMVPGDLGTSGGLRTDEYARVLRADDTVVRGLYAVGNTTAAVMGRSYAGRRRHHRSCHDLWLRRGQTPRQRKLKLNQLFREVPVENLTVLRIRATAPVGAR